jgi:hypothetical protein
MRAEGMISTNPSHAVLLELLAQGAEVGEFVQAAREAVPKGKGFGYALGVVKGQREDAARLAAEGVKGNGKLDPDAAAAFDELVESDGARPPRSAPVQSAIDAVGGWMRIRSRSSAESPSIKREFCRAYTEARSR